MKSLKLLTLVVAVVAALAALAAPASATIVTSIQGLSYTGGPLKIVSDGEILLDNEFGFLPFRCEWTLEASVESDGAGLTATGKFSNVTISCTDKAVATVLNKGSFEIHALPQANGTFTVAGLEVTMTHPAGFICIFGTGAGVDLGTLTSTFATGGNATIDATGAKIPRTGHSPFCGAETTVTGSFKVVTPTTLYIDQ
jgi:hypothetical protein